MVNWDFRVRFATSVNKLVLHQRRKFADANPNLLRFKRGREVADKSKFEAPTHNLVSKTHKIVDLFMDNSSKKSIIESEITE